MKWAEVGGAEKYKIEVAYDKAFTQITHGATVSGTSWTATKRASNTTHYWRVRVEEPSLGQWSEVWSWIIDTEDTGTYTFSVSSSNAAGVSITGSPSTYSGTTNYTKTGIASGTTLSLTAPATSGNYTFSSWSGCDSVSGTGNRICTVNMNNNRGVMAGYTQPTTGTLSFYSTSSDSYWEGHDF